MKKEFEHIESNYKPNWDKGKNWKEIWSKIKSREKKGVLFLWFKRVAAVLLLLSGWTLYFYKKDSNSFVKEPKVSTVIIRDTVETHLLIRDTIKIEKVVYKKTKTINPIISEKVDEMEISKPLVLTDEELNDDIAIEIQTSNKDSVLGITFIQNYSDNVFFGEINKVNKVKIRLFQRERYQLVKPTYEYFIVKTFK